MTVIILFLITKCWMNLASLHPATFFLFPFWLQTWFSSRSQCLKQREKNKEEISLHFTVVECKKQQKKKISVKSWLIDKRSGVSDFKHNAALMDFWFIFEHCSVAKQGLWTLVSHNWTTSTTKNRMENCFSKICAVLHSQNSVTRFCRFFVIS